MKNTYKILATLFLLAVFVNISSAVTPTCQAIVRNMSLGDTLGGHNNMLKYDINLLWTNPEVSDPFEYGSKQYCLTVNPAAIAGQTWAIKIINSELPASLQPGVSTNTATAQIRYSGNLPGTPFIVSSILPGTLIARTRITTNLPSFPKTSFGFAWRHSGVGLISKTCMCDERLMSPFAGDCGTYLIDSSGLGGQLSSVKLSNLNSIVIKNKVTLNWSTTKESKESSFDIERKLNKETEWTKIGTVTGNETKSYTFSETTDNGSYSYRLKQTDLNGNTEYFNLSNDVIVGVPTVYSISQNYPNPFNPTTSIDYDLPFDGKVSIVLYDISGKEAGALVNEVKTAGYYTLRLNASDLSSGIYFYKITANGNNQTFATTKKMVLIK